MGDQDFINSPVLSKKEEKMNSVATNGSTNGSTTTGDVLNGKTNGHAIESNGKSTNGATTGNSYEAKEVEM